MNKIILIPLFLLLIFFSYMVLSFRKIKFSYYILVGIINIWCISFFIYHITTKTTINTSLTVFNIVASIVFQFDKSTYRSAIVTKFSIGIARLLTSIPIVLSFFGGIAILAYTQPIAYLLGFYLLKANYEKSNSIISTNLVLSWLFLLFIAYFIFNQ